jgi:hypothetical protein
MRRTGSRSLGEFPHAVVRIECERCGRAGRYALAGLIERFGPARRRSDKAENPLLLKGSKTAGLSE